MDETNKGHALRVSRGHYERWLHGRGIDIGCGNAPLKLPEGTGSVEFWDLPQGDAQLVASCPDNHYDFVYSSHCLEHMRSVPQALRNWVRILKPGGVLYVAVPDFELYEHGRWPSAHNGDHKASFSLHRGGCLPVHLHYTMGDIAKLLFYGMDQRAKLILAELQDEGFDYAPDKSEVDQTLGSALAQIVFVARKHRNDTSPLTPLPGRGGEGNQK